ncbi:hypothetical protein EVG20_g6812 [Dentipellis fragilis]|uniref:Uncharacterized protein n=1 Tax=Dentipellis fragilis TaxID=205917 RepID=A0A4Y9YK85_9AGAM|nr:hypothetical protein EVG20_g6812 [Dentipellis fragilis]
MLRSQHLSPPNRNRAARGTPNSSSTSPEVYSRAESDAAADPSWLLAPRPPPGPALPTALSDADAALRIFLFLRAQARVAIAIWSWVLDNC